MGRRIVILSDVFLPMLLAEGEHHYEVTRDGLPDDARLIGANTEFITTNYMRLHLLFESARWDDGPEGAAYGELCPMMRRLDPDRGFVP